MGEPKVTIPLEITASDLADLEEWARNREEPLDVLLQEALQQYLRYTRDDIADLEERMKGPFYSIEEVEARLSQRRRRPRPQAAE
jgi:hypothetical protein